MHPPPPPDDAAAPDAARRVHPEHHTWARAEADGSVTVGITAHGIVLSGEIYMCRARPLGTAVDEGRSLAVVELAKAIVSVKSPIAGTVVAHNPLLDDEPEWVHREPEGRGWIARLQPASPWAGPPGAGAHSAPSSATTAGTDTTATTAGTATAASTAGTADATAAPVPGTAAPTAAAPARRHTLQRLLALLLPGAGRRVQALGQGIQATQPTRATLAALMTTAAPAARAQAGAAPAEPLRVLTAGAYKPVALAVAGPFGAAQGLAVQLDNDTAGALVRRAQAGEPFDLMLAPPASLAALAASGQLLAEPPTPLARVGIGVALRAGEALPPLQTVAQLRAALLVARRVAWIDPASGGSSGVYLARLFQQLGIAEALREKSVLVPGGLVAERLTTGEADLALHQISEILAVRGVQLAGPLPAEVQQYTVYAAALSRNARQPAAARAFVQALAGPLADAVLREKGLERP